MDTNGTNWKYLAPHPRLQYKQLCIRGKKIRADTIYSDYLYGESPEKIADDWFITVEAVREAIAYCASKPPEVEQDLDDEEAWMKARGYDVPPPAALALKAREAQMELPA